jgi:hypothetical protein
MKLASALTVLVGIVAIVCFFLLVGAFSSEAQQTTTDAVSGYSWSKHSIEITVPQKSETIRANLDLPSGQVLYGFSAGARTAPWAIQGYYLWSNPARGGLTIGEPQWFGKSTDNAQFSGQANRSYEWQILCEPFTWIFVEKQPLKPYIGYRKASNGWTFVGGKDKDGQIDLAAKHEIWFVGLVFQPWEFPIHLEADYGLLRTALEGGRTEKNHIDGILKGHRWHARLVTEWPFARGWWVQLAGEYSQSRSSGGVNYTAEKEMTTGDGSVRGEEWRLIWEVGTKW